MIIQNVKVNKKKKCLEVETPRGQFSLPFSKLALPPREGNNIKQAYIDKDLGNEAVTYVLDNGEADSIHLDFFLDYSKDPEYMTKIALYKLTLKAIQLVNNSRISKREIARKLKTSPTQLYRLLDTTNYSKTIDQMVKLLTALGYEIDFVIDQHPVIRREAVETIRQKFPHLRDEDLESTPASSIFKPLHSDHRMAA